MATAAMPRAIPRVTYSPETRATLDREDARRDWQNTQEVRFAAEQTRRFKIEAIGEQLDHAASRFRWASDAPGRVSDRRIARIERDYLEARAAYLSLMVELTGQGAADLERRIAA